jgi:hypothetical protein
MNTEKLIYNIYKGFLHREPEFGAVELWQDRIKSGWSIDNIIENFIQSEEFKMIQGKLQSLWVPPGHFYSPIVNADDLINIFEKNNNNPESLKKLEVDKNTQLTTWKNLLPYLQSIPFPEEKSQNFRYYFNNNSFSYADGSILHAMLRAHRPQRLIEVGSGHSSACAIDTIDHFLNGDVQVTFIEPYPKLLLDLLGEERVASCKIHSLGVQQIDAELFQTLESGDFLFIDSTHVMKTGSDVCHELFDILPDLKTGVFVHFHDIFWPFEYPADWVMKENRSWNEIYGLRAFLMYNDTFQIEFFNDFFVKNFYDLVEEAYPPHVEKFRWKPLAA